MAGTHKSRFGEAVVSTVPVEEIASVESAPVEAKPSGKCIKAIPFSGGTTVVIRDIDFKAGNIEHPAVTWDYRIDDFTVKVGEAITEEAANFLVQSFPDSFKFV